MHPIPDHGDTFSGLPVNHAQFGGLIRLQHAVRAAILSALGRSEVGGVISCAQQQDIGANYHLAC
jgi:hypothetical protein